MILGLDTAAVDGNAPPDFHAAKAAGASFIYLRKVQHIYTDTYYTRDAQRARDAGLAVGAYLFPSFGSRSASPRAQVQALKNAPGDILHGTDLPPCLDVEFPGGIQAVGRDKLEIISLLELFIREFQDAFNTNPVIYTSYDQWFDIGLPKAPWIVNCPLWIKTAYRLNARQPVDQVIPHDPHVGVDAADPKDYYRVPDPWSKYGWSIQQFQGDALGFPGFNKTVDVNRFRGAKQGDKGTHVQWIQARLNKFMGANLVEDGEFGPKTSDTLKEYQLNNQLMPDGEFGPKTFASLAW